MSHRLPGRLALGLVALAAGTGITGSTSPGALQLLHP
jgi:hypothetical protein